MWKFVLTYLFYFRYRLFFRALGQVIKYKRSYKVVSRKITLSVKKIKEKNLNETLELIWTIAPSLLIFFIALPTFSLIYQVESNPCNVFAIVKVIGNQWFWTYESSICNLNLVSEAYLNLNCEVSEFLNKSCCFF